MVENRSWRRREVQKWGGVVVWRMFEKAQERRGERECVRGSAKMDRQMARRAALEEAEPYESAEGLLQV